MHGKKMNNGASLVQLCSITLVTGLLILLRSATKITHKAQAVTCFAAKWHVCATLDSFDTTTSEIATGGQVFHSTERGELDDGEAEDEDESEDEEDELDNSKLIPSYAYSTISFQKRQALGN